MYYPLDLGINLLNLIKNNSFNKKDLVLKSNMGELFGSTNGIYTWQSSQEIVEYFKKYENLKIKELFGVGVVQALKVILMN